MHGRYWICIGLIAWSLASLPPARAQEQAPAELMAEVRKEYREADRGRVREVRLALVCYGGSSLAIYMHGNTKEILRLVQASKALQKDSGGLAIDGPAMPAAGPAGRQLQGSARQWYERLLKLWYDDPQKVRTRVVVDVIAGTSAGGINGVILAKALANDLSVDKLTDLWLNRASLARLTNGYLGFLGVFGGRPPINGKALVGWLHEALAGMDEELLSRGGAKSLLPDGDRLDLFVTVTDHYGYVQGLRVGDPVSAVEKGHLHLMHFVYSGQEGCDPSQLGDRGLLNDFCPQWTPALTFAARATSSIPGVFPPLNLGETLQQLAAPAGGNAYASPQQVEKRFFRSYQLQSQAQVGGNTYFVDGGVLDNHPFGPAIDSVLTRPQDQEVRRFLLYLQPDPLIALPGLQEKAKKPGLLKSVWAGLSGIPRGQPILEEMNEIADQEMRSQRIRDLVAAEERAALAFESRQGVLKDCSDFRRLPIAQRVACRLSGSAEYQTGGWMAQLADQARLHQLREQMEEAASTGGMPESAQEQADAERFDSLGRSYLNLRVHSVLAQFAKVISSPNACDYPEDTAHRALVAKIIEGWAARHNLIDDPAAPRPNRVDEAAERQRLEDQKQFLRQFDVGYARRQLRFVMDWIDGQYGSDLGREQRETLDRLKRAASERREELTGLIRGTDTDEELRAQLAALGKLFCNLEPWPKDPAQPAESLDRQAAEFVDGPGMVRLDEVRAGLGPVLERRQQEVRDKSIAALRQEAASIAADDPAKLSQILVRYLGFPFWDRQIYPYTAFSAAGELEPIRVWRLSPGDAPLLGSHRLKGIQKAHFGAFLSRPGREGDYLWGRLDAVDRLLNLLERGDSSAAKEIFSAILDEERASGLIRPQILAERQAAIAKLP